MITVVVRVERSVEALAVTLAALVPGVAAGLVADAVILVGRADDGVARLADAAGAAVLATPDRGWVPGAGVARREWLWCLLDGDAPADGWIRAVGQFVSLAPADGRALGRPSYRPLSPAARMTRLMERAGTRRVRAGDLVRRDFVAAPSRIRPLALGTSVARDPAFR